jgi:hypothetical protein
LINIDDGTRQNNAGRPKRWFRRSAIRLVKAAVHLDRF